MKAALFAWISLVFLVCGFPAAEVLSAAAAQCQEGQRRILIDLRSSLTFEPAGAENLKTWNRSLNCCEWEGVACDDGGMVVGIDVSNKSIAGWNTSFVFGLSRLRQLNLAFNNFNSPISGEIANLRELETLNLSNAGFTGQVPAQLSQLANLTVLDLSVSSLLSSAKIILASPNLAFFASKLRGLRELLLDGIDLSGDGDNWAHVISSSLPDLRVLSMQSCNLFGPFHDSLQSLRLLARLCLSQNNFFSSVPNFFAGFSNLTELRMSSCGLTGEFPTSVLALPLLEILDLSYNPMLSISFPEFLEDQPLRQVALTGTVILGALPHSFGFLKKISRVEIAGCNMTGSIPISVERLEHLLYVDLSSNDLNGSLPSFRTSSNLSHLDLSNNQLSGGISSAHFEGMMSLKWIDLSRNQLNGTLPASLFSIPSLQTILLSFNQFFGVIPDIPNAASLSVKTIELESNILSGRIPRSFFDLANLNVLDLSFNSLSGAVLLDWTKKMTNLTNLNLSHNNLTVQIDNQNLSSIPFPQFTKFRLSSCNLKVFPHLGTQSKLYLLDLSNNQIPEVLPWLTNSSTLQYLNLSSNELRTLPTPSNFGELLVLDVHNNQLHGGIPLPPKSATYVDYSNNNFSSILPSALGVNWTAAILFSVANNNLTGVIPESLCLAPFLRVLDLSENSFVGTIPDCLFGMGNLGVLNLRRNNLAGVIPDRFNANCSIQTLVLNDNRLNGTVPSTISNCSKLEVLDLGNNELHDRFPCTLNSLRVLILRNNKFYGEIGCPTDGRNWTVLQIVDLAYNSFSGALPEDTMLSWNAMIFDGKVSHNHLRFTSLALNNNYYEDSITVVNKGVEVELGKILTIFTSIDFSGNKLEGPLPEAIGQLTALYLLNLSHNSFGGPILPGIGNLKQLESLDLSDNKLSGTIPPELSQLPFISFLNLSSNKLRGKIPLGQQLQTFQASSYYDNPELCGPPLPVNCSDSSILRSSLSKTDVLNWNYILPGIGIGMGAAAVVAPLLFSETLRNYYDDLVEKMLATLLPFLGYVYIKKGDWRLEHGEISDDDGLNSDTEDEIEEDESTTTMLFCLYCSRLDSTMVRVIHDPKCACYPSPPTFSPSPPCRSCHT